MCAGPLVWNATQASRDTGLEKLFIGLNTFFIEIGVIADKES